MVRTSLVVVYKDIKGRHNTLYTNIAVDKGYVLDCKDTPDFATELERRIQDNTYDTILFDKSQWISDEYRNKYETQIQNTYKDIQTIHKIYTATTAWKHSL